jgi:hypothetical protein
MRNIPVERGASRSVVEGAGRADTGPPGSSGVVRGREVCLERQIAFQKGVIQAIALTGRFGLRRQGLLAPCLERAIPIFNPQRQRGLVSARSFNRCAFAPNAPSC